MVKHEVGTYYEIKNLEVSPMEHHNYTINVLNTVQLEL